MHISAANNIRHFVRLPSVQRRFVSWASTRYSDQTVSGECRRQRSFLTTVLSRRKESSKKHPQRANGVWREEKGGRSKSAAAFSCGVLLAYASEKSRGARWLSKSWSLGVATQARLTSPSKTEWTSASIRGSGALTTAEDPQEGGCISLERTR
jgi:hypothetical protein